MKSYSERASPRATIATQRVPKEAGGLLRVTKQPILEVMEQTQILNNCDAIIQSRLKKTWKVTKPIKDIVLPLESCRFCDFLHILQFYVMISRFCLALPLG